MTTPKELTPEKLIKQDPEVCSFPEIFYRILEAIEDEDSGFDDIARLINTDAGLSSRLLKIVNSSFYGLSSEVDTIPHAINIIGTQELCDMILATTVMSQFKNIPEEFVTMDSFWVHSITSGLVARDLAQRSRIENTEKVYVGGMIHEIGSLIIYKQLPTEAKEALIRCNQWGQNLCFAEQEVLGFDHTQVGSVLAREWKLPQIFVEVIAYHHNPFEAPTFKKETAIVYLADYISQDSRLGSSGEFHAGSLDPKVWSFLGLDPACLSDISKGMLQRFENTLKIFRN